MSKPKKSSVELKKETDKIEWTRSLMEQARASDLYGEVKVIFEGGVITRAYIIRSLVPPE